MSKTINYDNWYNKPNSLTHNLNPIYSFNQTRYNDKPIISIKEFHKLEYSKYLKSITNDVVRIEFSEIAFQYPKFDPIMRIDFPYDIKEILNDVVNLEFNIIEETKLIYDIEEELNNSDLISRLNYKTQYLFDVINTYDKYIYNHVDKHQILREVFKLTHSANTHYNKEKLNEWIENFPNMIDNKIRAIKNKQKDKIRSKKAKKRYKNSQLRFLNIIRQINNLGYYDFDESQIKYKMSITEIGDEDEIIQDLINEFSEINQDHDMIEIKELKHPNQDYYLEQEQNQYLDYLENKVDLTVKEKQDLEELNK